MGKSYKQLSFVERALIQTQLVLRWSPAAIAAGLQRARSTVTREMARNGWLPEPEIVQRGVVAWIKRRSSFPFSHQGYAAIFIWRTESGRPASSIRLRTATPAHCGFNQSTLAVVGLLLQAQPSL